MCRVIKRQVCLACKLSASAATPQDERDNWPTSSFLAIAFQSLASKPYNLKDTPLKGTSKHSVGLDITIQPF